MWTKPWNGSANALAYDDTEAQMQETWGIFPSHCFSGLDKC